MRRHLWAVTQSPQRGGRRRRWVEEVAVSAGSVGAVRRAGNAGGFLVALGLAGVFSLGGAVGRTSAEEDAGVRYPGVRPACVHVEARAQFWGMAYRHWVRVHNACDRAQRCELHTDVNPERQRLLLPAGSRREVVTFTGSPARKFTPTVHCRPPGERAG